MRAVNLIPAQQRGGASVGAGRSGGAAYAVLALMAGLAVMAFLYGSAHRKVSAEQGKAASIATQVSQTQAQAAQLTPYTSFLTLREQRVQAVTSLVDTRFDWAHVFHEFARVMPLGVSLSSLSGTVGTVSATTPSGAPSAAASAASASSASSVASATPPGSVPTFTISGCALSQPEVARMLVRLRLMDGVSSVALQSSTRGSVSGGGGSSANTACPPGAPVFTATVNFQALPTPPASLPAAKTVADTTPAATSSSTSSGATP